VCLLTGNSVDITLPGHGEDGCDSISETNIRNKMTQQQEGCIVRIADISQGSAYIVSINLDERWGKTNNEALWTEADVKTT
jgi:hypothetical protein